MKVSAGGVVFLILVVALWWYWPFIYEGPADPVEGFVAAERYEPPAPQPKQNQPVSKTPAPQPVSPPLTDQPSLPEQQKTKTAKQVESRPASTPIKSPENVSADFRSREFSVPDKYPGHNLEVLEEKKVEFLIQELNLFPADAEEVSRRYVESVDASNQVMRNRPDEAMEEMSRIVAEYEEWLRDKIGEEDFQRYSEFVDSSMRDLQERYKDHYENQGN